MNRPIFFLLPLLFICCLTAHSQTAPSEKITSEPIPARTIEEISNELGKISKSLVTFNDRLGQFLESVNKYKGVQLTEQQQKIIFGYEILNQTEQLAATLRKTLIETTEREASTKRRLGQIDLDLRPENIDRTVQLRGTTRADEARELRRRSLEDERSSLQRLLGELGESRNQISENLKQTENFAENFRRNLFSRLSVELSGF